ncbi:MAG: M48 family metallopeptidase [Gammaproteobacteria bacterium]|nr:M48 family metallopeptidase [Gammaproteobacteria bacterium]
MKNKLILLLAAATALIVACATSPLGRDQLILFPDEQLDQMGVTAWQQLQEQTPVDDGRRVNRYVACIAQAVTSELPGAEAGGWEVSVFEDDDVNAFALPGKKIGVYEGLLGVAENQNQLAAVIGHEVAHVVSQHANERVSTAFATQTGLQLAQIAAGATTPVQQQLFSLLGLGAQVGIVLPFGRAQEAEADLIGLDLMAKAGFDPRSSVELWQNMAEAGGQQPPEFLSTHPSGASRINNLNARMPHAMELYEQARAQGKRPDCGPP